MTATWVPMTEDDLADVDRIADVVHVDYPEDSAVLADRLAVFPKGCFTLKRNDGVAVGYALTHPWMFGEPPALNVMLGKIPEGANTYYIHDVAMLPETRGSGCGTAVMGLVLETAKALGLSDVSLVAVNNSGAFWGKQGFAVFEATGALSAKLKSYDDDARYMVRAVT